ncbi:DUF892 family protein [Micromonospora globbae]|uniref:DUF892 family protein n=1 Tax=Micromonospora globbae TaxID=1894969 RepID=UPI00386ED6CB|nr:DUF892 family protein [Micromonospora globbae]
MNNAYDLFLYELGVMSQAERSGSTLLSILIAKRVKDPDLERILHRLEADSHHHADNIDACLRGIHVSTIHATTAAIDGLRTDFEEFTRLQPAAEILDLYALDTAKRFTHLAIATYQNLTDTARTLKHHQCSQQLDANLTDKQRNATHLEHIRNTVAQQVSAT